MASTINIKFPLQDDPTLNNAFQLNSISKDAYSSDLLLLLLTEKGSRYMDPDYGTNLIKYLFDPEDSITTDNIKDEIKSTVKLYIPNLTIQNIDFITSEMDQEVLENQIKVSVKFTFDEGSFSETNELNITF